MAVPSMMANYLRRKYDSIDSRNGGGGAAADGAGVVEPYVLPNSGGDASLKNVETENLRDDLVRTGTPYAEVIKGTELSLKPFPGLRQAPTPTQPLRSVTTLPARPDANFDSLDYRLGNQNRSSARPDANFDARDYMARNQNRGAPMPLAQPPSLRGVQPPSLLNPTGLPSVGSFAMSTAMQPRAQTRTQPAAPVAAAAPANNSYFDNAVNFVLAREGGFVPDDAGKGPTNFGINSAANPGVDVKSLTRDGAVDIYRKKYWDANKIGDLPPEMQLAAFDAAVNQPGSLKFLKQYLNNPYGFVSARRGLYNRIADADPSKRQYLKGWQKRMDELEKQLAAQGIKPGLKHGGQIKGYNNSGLVPKMKAKGLRGYATGGPIGNVMEDTGEDTVDAKVRPGEYLLNPETVATGFGAGNYDKGVRTLNQIVRDATGQEPGPTPVGKDGERGFAEGGVVDKAKRAAKTAADKLKSVGSTKQMKLVTDDFGNSIAVPEEKAKVAKSSAPKTPQPEQPMTRAQRAGLTVGGDLRKVAKMLPSPETVMKSANSATRLANMGASRVLVPLALGNTVLDVGSVAANGTVGDTINEFLGDTARIVGGLGGASAGTFLGPVGAAAGGIGGYSLADQGVRAVRRGLGLDERDPSEILKAKQSAETSKVASEAPTFQKVNAPPEAAVKERLGLRDPQLMQTAYRLAALDGNRFAAEMLVKQQEQMAEIAKAQAAGGGGGAAGMKAVDDFFQNSRMQPELDSKGNPTGKSVPDAVGQAGLRDRLVEISRAEGIDPYKVGLGGANQLRNEVDMAERLVRAANSKTGASDPRMYAVSPNLEDNRDTVRDERLVPRFRLPEAESAEDQPYGFRRGVTLRDVNKNEGVNTWDWLKAKFSGDLDEANQLVFDTATGEYLPLSEISGDLELMDRYFPEFKRRNMLERRK